MKSVAHAVGDIRGEAGPAPLTLTAGGVPSIDRHRKI